MNDLYPCAVILSQALCDVSRIGALGLSSVLAHFTYGHIHTVLFNCQGTVICGGSYLICGIHYGGSIHITVGNNISSIGSQRNGGKFAMLSKNLNIFPLLTQLVANKKALKGQCFDKFIRNFFAPPSSSQRNEAKRARLLQISQRFL